MGYTVGKGEKTARDEGVIDEDMDTYVLNVDEFNVNGLIGDDEDLDVDDDDVYVHDIDDLEVIELDEYT